MRGCPLFYIRMDINFYEKGARIMKFIEIIKRSFDSSHIYSQQELIQIVQTLDLSPENVIPYITPQNTWNTDEISFIIQKPGSNGSLLPSLAKTPIHNHGTSTGCIYIVQGDLQNILYNFEPSETTPTYHQTQQFTQGNVFTVDKDTIHMMQNNLPLPAITFHVYSPSLEGVTIHSS